MCLPVDKCHEKTKMCERNCIEKRVLETRWTEAEMRTPGDQRYRYNGALLNKAYRKTTGHQNYVQASRGGEKVWLA